MRVRVMLFSLIITILSALIFYIYYLHKENAKLETKIDFLNKKSKIDTSIKDASLKYRVEKDKILNTKEKRIKNVFKKEKDGYIDFKDIFN